MITPVVWHDSATNSLLSALIYNPANSFWTNTAGGVLQLQNEATWVKLPDDSILTADMQGNATASITSERFIPSLNNWILDKQLPVSLQGTGHETGPAFMMADGRAFFLGGSGHTAFYSPSGNTNNGDWSPGPDMPYFNGQTYFYGASNILTNVFYSGLLMAQDTPAAMMNNGKILCQFACNTYHAEVWFYEYDPSIANFVAAPCPTNASPGTGFVTSAGMSDRTSMLDLPDGTVLYNDGGYLYIYQPDNTPPLASGKPVIKSVSFNADGSLHLSGTLFNGISQGASYGDDFQMDSNYPLVRFTDGSGLVSYGRTYNWSSTSVQTGGKIVTTECAAPANIYNGPGAYSLQVVANGNASDPVNFFGPVWVDFNYTGSIQNGNLATPYKTLAQGTSAVASGGTVAINGGVQPSLSPETMAISKPMNIISVSGPSTIGQ